MRASRRLQWGRGLSTAETGQWNRTSVQRRGFNGAAVSQPRKPAVQQKAIQHYIASMGPRSLNRGNFGGFGRLVTGTNASMGPRSLNRGNSSDSNLSIFKQLKEHLRAGSRNRIDRTSGFHNSDPQ